MTTPQNPRVTQADREAAADLERYSCGPASEIKRLRSGELDDDYCVQAFARHRETAEAEAKAREAALVEALKSAPLIGSTEHPHTFRCRQDVWLRDVFTPALAALTKEPDA